jgi:hypothetical protein
MHVRQPETTVRKMQLALVFLPALAVAIGLFYLRPSSAHAVGFNLVALVLAGWSMGGVFASVTGRKIARVMAAAVLVLYWVALGAISFLILLNPVFVLIYYGVFILPIFLLVALCTKVVRANVNPRWMSRSEAAAFICGLIVVVVIAAPALRKTAERNAPWVRPPDPNVLGQDMFTLVKCSREFALLHPKAGYPESLQELDPQGTGCLPEGLLSGTYKGFSLSYQTGLRDANGRITGFTMKAEQTSPHGPDFSVMSTDESGLVVYSFQGPHGKGGQSLYSPAADSIDMLLNCVRNASSEKGRDVNQADLWVQQCLRNQTVVTKGRGRWGLYDFAYKFERSESGDISGSIMDVRPHAYGIGGIRSYLMVDRLAASGAHTFRVYATPEDRRANTSDPFAKMCEIRWGACTSPAQLD